MQASAAIPKTITSSAEWAVVLVLKEDPKGVSRMSSVMEKYFKEELLEARTEASAEGRAEGRAEGHLEMLINLVKKGLLSTADAAKELSISEKKFTSML